MNKMNYCLLELIIPHATIKYAPIGSREYAPNLCTEYADYDVLFLEQDKDFVVERLKNLCIPIRKGGSGSIKFSIQLFPNISSRYIEYNFCFVKDLKNFQAWIVATAALKGLCQSSHLLPIPEDKKGLITKEERMQLFATIVTANGGEDPKIIYT